MYCKRVVCLIGILFVFCLCFLEKNPSKGKTNEMFSSPEKSFPDKKKYDMKINEEYAYFGKAKRATRIT